MNPIPLDDYLHTQALCQWACELAEAVAGVSDDHEQRHVAWKTLARLMAGRSFLRRVHVAYTFLLQLLKSANRLGTVSLAEFMRSEFMIEKPDSWMRILDEARERAIARIGQE